MKWILSLFALVIAGFEGECLTRFSATTTEPTAVQGSPMGQFRRRFTSSERRINIFVENMKQTQKTMDSVNEEFIHKLREYENQLPKSKTISVLQKSRSTCNCEGQRRSPCPSRCVDSCHYCDSRRGCWHTSDNCTRFLDRITDCYCYDGSLERCNNGDLSECYSVSYLQVPSQEPCVEFTPNRTMIETSYLHFSKLLTEPFKKRVRDLDFQLAFLRQSTLATDILVGHATLTCAEQDEEPCHSEAAKFFPLKLSIFKQLQNNLTLDMIKTQEHAEKASRNLNNLKERVLAQVAQTIKRFTCCLNGLTFSVTDNECDSTTESAPVESERPSTDFWEAIGYPKPTASSEPISV